MAAPAPHSLLARLGASARPAGSAAEADARKYCSETLSANGFAVFERPFSYSAFPGVWGPPLIGIALVLTAAVTEFALMHTSVADAILERALVIIAALAICGWWLSRYGTRFLAFMRRAGINLEARRGEPVVWLVAHLDSKSQSVSLLTRACASIAVAGFWAAVFIALGASVFVQIPGGVIAALVACAGVAAVPLAVAGTGRDGSGALDNASGVASIIVAVQRMGEEIPVGLVITSAEELGLAGARAWVEGKPGGIAINCDGVDDSGELTLTASGRGHELLRGMNLRRIFGRKVRIRKNLPGVLLDSTAFSDQGWAAFTVSQGRLQSLARIHTRRDCLDELSGSSIERTGELIAALAGAIIAGEVSLHTGKGVPEAHETKTSE